MATVALCRKVLVLNEGPAIHNLLRFLKEFDRESMVTANGEPLQASLNEKRFDAVVLDIRGPHLKTVEEMRGIGEIRAEWVGKLLVIVAKVNGMSCPFCTYGLRKEMLTIPGVQDGKVSLRKSQAILKVDPGAKVTDAQVRHAIREAGFSAGAITHE